MVKQGMLCPSCGIARTTSYNSEFLQTYTGMTLPTVCSNKKDCPAGNQPHLHCSCISCHDTWMMATRDGK